jgi:hypothetical protein
VEEVITMTERDREEAGDDQRRLTRRAAIATGAAAYAGGMLLGPAALAARTPRQLLEALRAEIRDSRVHDGLKSRLLELTGDVKADLKRGANAHARKTLRKRVIPLLRESGGHQGLSERLAGEWVAEAKRIAAKIPHDDGVQGPNGASVYVFNSYNEAVSSLGVAGGVVGDIAGWSRGSGQVTQYTPSARPVPRVRNATPGGFAVGDNAVRIPWDSYTGRATVTIPSPGSSPVSLDDDLILLLTLTQAILESTRGFVLSTFPVSLQ